MTSTPVGSSLCQITRIPLVILSLILASPVSHSVGDERFRMRTVLMQLGETTAGRSLLLDAKRFWKVKTQTQIMTHLGWSDVSKTDAVLTRHFDPQTGEERRERMVNIFLKRDQSVAETVLDLAHELVHATQESDWDPYDPTLEVVDYIHQSIEGPGGEVEAVYLECLVSAEIAPVYVLPYDRCSRYTAEVMVSATKKKRTKVIRQKIVTDFYRVGEQYLSLKAHLGDQAARLKNLSGDEAQLISSTWNEPYPMALYLEYEAMTESACKNSKRRLASLARKSARSPASEKAKSWRSQKRRAEAFIEARCRHLVAQN